MISMKRLRLNPMSISWIESSTYNLRLEGQGGSSTDQPIQFIGRPGMMCLMVLTSGYRMARSPEKNAPLRPGHRRAIPAYAVLVFIPPTAELVGLCSGMIARVILHKKGFLSTGEQK